MMNFGRAKLHNAASVTIIKMIFLKKPSCLHAKKLKAISHVRYVLRFGAKPMMRITEEEERKTPMPEPNL
jgi:hypothetical protein